MRVAKNRKNGTPKFLKMGWFRGSKTGIFRHFLDFFRNFQIFFRLLAKQNFKKPKKRWKMGWFLKNRKKVVKKLYQCGRRENCWGNSKFFFVKNFYLHKKSLKKFKFFMYDYNEQIFIFFKKMKKNVIFFAQKRWFFLIDLYWTFFTFRKNRVFLTFWVIFKKIYIYKETFEKFRVFWKIHFVIKSKVMGFSVWYVQKRFCVFFKKRFFIFEKKVHIKLFKILCFFFPDF